MDEDFIPSVTRELFDVDPDEQVPNPDDPAVVAKTFGKLIRWSLDNAKIKDDNA